MKLTKRENELLAVLFASGEPVEKARLAEALELDMGEVTDALTSLAGQLTAENSPLELRRLEDSYQLCTAASYAPVIRRALEMKRNIPLSAAAMETLAIISYNQPVTRGFVEQVRGVDSSSVVVSLVEKGLVEEAGRMDLPGRPLAYRTTPAFLRCFGLTSLNELPAVDEQLEEQTEVEDPEEQITFAELPG
ncbi:MAG: SMC-Scp complex subunit ScpB [Angelakisella sp.]